MEATARLRNLPIAPRKVQLVAGLVRGVSVTKGLTILRHTPKKCAVHVEKLLLSAVANWEKGSQEKKLEDVNLYVKTIVVGHAGMLKRLQPAPQGRAHRIRKRASHITLVVDEIPLPDEKKGESIKSNKNGAKS